MCVLMCALYVSDKRASVLCFVRGLQIRRRRRCYLATAAYIIIIYSKLPHTSSSGAEWSRVVVAVIINMQVVDVVVCE